MCILGNTQIYFPSFSSFQRMFENVNVQSETTKLSPITKMLPYGSLQCKTVNFIIVYVIMCTCDYNHNTTIQTLHDYSPIMTSCANTILHLKVESCMINMILSHWKALKS